MLQNPAAPLQRVDVSFLHCFCATACTKLQNLASPGSHLYEATARPFLLVNSLGQCVLRWLSAFPITPRIVLRDSKNESTVEATSGRIDPRSRLQQPVHCYFYTTLEDVADSFSILLRLNNADVHTATSWSPEWPQQKNIRRGSIVYHSTLPLFFFPNLFLTFHHPSGNEQQLQTRWQANGISLSRCATPLHRDFKLHRSRRREYLGYAGYQG